MPSFHDEDRAALIDAIEGENAAWVVKDYDRWASFWLQSPAVCHWGWNPVLGVQLLSGWDEISSTFQNAMRAFPEPEPVMVQNIWHHFFMTPDMALVIVDQRAPDMGHLFVEAGMKRELKVLVRDHGRWLHLCIVSLQPAVEGARCPVVRVDSAGQVLWQNTFALEKLANHPGLVLRNGRLRARSRAADRALQAAIAWAAGALFGPTKRVALGRAGVTGGALPVLAAEAEDGAQVLCWVQPIDGAIVVSFDNTAELEQRLATTAVIFGLSPSQQRLVQLLAEGRDLAEAALAMSVSVNTLRTQIRRIFEKTGVHTQAALLRLMLSIAPPFH